MVTVMVDVKEPSAATECGLAATTEAVLTESTAKAAPSTPKVMPATTNTTTAALCAAVRKKPEQLFIQYSFECPPVVAITYSTDNCPKLKVSPRSESPNCGYDPLYLIGTTRAAVAARQLIAPRDDVMHGRQFQYMPYWNEVNESVRPQPLTRVASGSSPSGDVRTSDFPPERNLFDIIHMVDSFGLSGRNCGASRESLRLDITDPFCEIFIG